MQPSGCEHEHWIDLAERLDHERWPVVRSDRTGALGERQVGDGRFLATAVAAGDPADQPWHVDAVDGYRHPAIRSMHESLVLLCDGACSSSLAAANLVEVGFTNVRDLVGVMRAWVLGCVPSEEPDRARPGTIRTRC